MSIVRFTSEYTFTLFTASYAFAPFTASYAFGGNPPVTWMASESGNIWAFENYEIMEYDGN